MRVNVYVEEMTERVEIVSKTIDGQEFKGVRFYLELPATVQMAIPGTGHTSGAASVRSESVAGPFIHREGDDDSAAVTFWGKGALRGVLIRALQLLDSHHIAGERARDLHDKVDNILNESSCWNLARVGEPMFVLLGRDLAAADVLRFWINERIASGKNQREDAQISDAEKIAVQMREYSLKVTSG